MDATSTGDHNIFDDSAEKTGRTIVHKNITA